MRWKELLKYAVYCLALFYLHFLDARLGVQCFALAFLMALVYNKQNLLVILPLYFGTALAVTPALTELLIAGIPTVGVPLVCFVHYKLKRVLKLSFISAYLFLFGIPALALGEMSVAEIILKVVGVVGAQIALQVFVNAIYSVLVRKFRYALTGEELAAFGGVLFILGLGLPFLEIGRYSPYFTLLALGAAVSAAIRKGSVLPLCFAFGMGAAVAKGAPEYMALALVYGGVALILAGTPIPLTAVAIVVADGLYYVFFKGEIDLLTLVAPAVGGLVASCIPKRLLQAGKTRWGLSAEGQTARALVNRERREMAGQIGELGQLFTRMEEVLAAEWSDEKEEEDVARVALETERRCCVNCLSEGQCRELLGGSTAAVMENLTISAMQNGRASILDTPSFLSSRCRKLNGVIATVNEEVEKRREMRKRQENATEGRKLLSRQMGGLGEILGALQKDVGRFLSYDTERERLIRKALSNADIFAEDVIVYGGDITASMTISIPEGDLDNPYFLATVNSIMGAEMIITKQEKGVKGMVSAHLERAPEYRVLYGERAQSATEGEDSGDQLKAIRLSGGKVMLMLSDGMGHGDEAGRNSRYALSLIEGFYRLGFDHRTIVRSVANLLSLKDREEFDAVDIAMVDTYTGQCDFIKLGGRESFLMKDGAVDVVECGSLPLGIVEEAEPLLETRTLTEGTFLVMVSDGVIDAIGKENMIRLLEGEKSRNPDRIAAVVLENALRLQEEDKKDDISVLVAKLMRANLSSEKERLNQRNPMSKPTG